MADELLGIEIGGTKLQLLVGDPGLVIRRRWRFGVDPAQGAAGIRNQLEATISEIASRWPIAGVGVGFGGPVDARAGRVLGSHQIAGWADFDLAGWVKGLTGAPTRIENDANTGALAEATTGAGKGESPVFYVTLGSGVGGGLVVDGEIYHGASPGEAEIGHVRLDRKGTTVEGRCSGWAVDQRIRERVTGTPRGRLAHLVQELQAEGKEARCLGPALAEGDPDALAILREVADDLALGLSHVVHLFHPSVIVLGGGLALVGEPLRHAVESVLQGRIMTAFAPGPGVRLAALGEEMVPVGGLILAHRSLSSPGQASSN